VEVRNTTDNLVYQAEKALKDNADKIDAELKTEIEGKIAAAQAALKDNNIEQMRSTSEELTRSLQKVGERVYQQAQQGAPAGGAHGPHGAPGTEKKPNGDVVDADFKEVS
jgi:molecular chaperone DnaK